MTSTTTVIRHGARARLACAQRPAPSSSTASLPSCAADAGLRWPTTHDARHGRWATGDGQRSRCSACEGYGTSSFVRGASIGGRGMAKRSNGENVARTASSDFRFGTCSSNITAVVVCDHEQPRRFTPEEGAASRPGIAPGSSASVVSSLSPGARCTYYKLALVATMPSTATLRSPPHGGMAFACTPDSASSPHNAGDRLELTFRIHRQPSCETDEAQSRFSTHVIIHLPVTCPHLLPQASLKQPTIAKRLRILPLSSAECAGPTGPTFSESSQAHLVRSSLNRP
ncbi:hypothetical protein EJ04DRAFT_271707 [Polyplosphaeria fusca]|uniref:Uncharacterized protein n=1 Tax=Polyplosphaeria fusca TaxID=682080 RepID=A0A9P4V0F6_9PLEO|nr:hypothetical protein EJ04DRAFT_271707 [Polyplosphaeria fusca]